jgi:hypothetical protein
MAIFHRAVFLDVQSFKLSHKIPRVAAYIVQVELCRRKVAPFMPYKPHISLELPYKAKNLRH